jgi:hypothetical protein
LASLRERLDSFFEGRAKLALTSATPRGVVAEIDFPVLQSDR